MKKLNQALKKLRKKMSPLFKIKKIKTSNKREKQLKGIPDYNMEHNPAYIEMFALDVVSAHKFIRRIGKPAVDYKKMERKHYRGQRESLDKETLERKMEEEKHLEAVKARRQAKLPDKFQANPMTQQNPMHTSGRGRGRGRGRGQYLVGQFDDAPLTFTISFTRGPRQPPQLGPAHY